MHPERAAIRKAHAQKESEEAAKSIAGKTGVDPSILKASSKDPLVNGVLKEEALRDFLKSLDEALPEAGEKFDEMKVDKLKELAAERGIENAASMKKPELLAALKGA